MNCMLLVICNTVHCKVGKMSAWGRTNHTLHSPHPQTATEEVTALCQPPSPTTRPMTATLEAPTTAQTEAAVVPLVRGLGH